MDVTQSRLWCYKNICGQDCYQKKIGASKFLMGGGRSLKLGKYPKEIQIYLTALLKVSRDLRIQFCQETSGMIASQTSLIEGVQFTLYVQAASSKS